MLNTKIVMYPIKIHIQRQVPKLFQCQVSREAWLSPFQNIKRFQIPLQQEMMEGDGGDSWNSLRRAKLQSDHHHPHANSPTLSFFTGRMPFLSPN